VDAGTAASLLGAGLLAGAVNTLAGGGSLVLVPALIAAGMPSTIANATSRIPILAQCAAGAVGFARGGKLPTAAVRNVLPPVMVGAGVGAYVATLIPPRVLTPMILGTLVLMAIALVAVSPSRWAPPPDATPRDPPAGRGAMRRAVRRRRSTAGCCRPARASCSSASSPAACATI
jgi:uncharacterized membrane protein YfcA